MARFRGTLVHILWGEWLGLRRWQGESPWQVFPAEEFSNWIALESRWGAVEQEQNVFLENLTDARLSVRVSYDNLQSVRWDTPLVK